MPNSHICEFCNKVLNSPSALEVHRRVHTNERPYTCDKCPMAFKQECLLNRHKREVHKESSQLHCTFCPSKYSRKGDLRKHIKYRHNKSLADKSTQTDPSDQGLLHELSEVIRWGSPYQSGSSPPQASNPICQNQGQYLNNQTAASNAGWNAPLIAGLITRAPPLQSNRTSSPIQRQCFSGFSSAHNPPDSQHQQDIQQAIRESRITAYQHGDIPQTSNFLQTAQPTAPFDELSEYFEIGVPPSPSLPSSPIRQPQHYSGAQYRSHTWDLPEDWAQSEEPTQSSSVFRPPSRNK